MYDLGGFYRIQPIANVLNGGDQVFRLDEVWVVSNKCRIHRQVFVEVDVGMGHALHIVKLLAHLGNACDFAHHPGNGELGHGFFSMACAVRMNDVHRALAASSEEHRANGQHPNLRCWA